MTLNMHKVFVKANNTGRCANILQSGTAHEDDDSDDDDDDGKGNCE